MEGEAGKASQVATTILVLEAKQGGGRKERLWAVCVCVCVNVNECIDV